MSLGASGDGSPSDCNRALSMADVWTLFNFILLWMMALTRAGEKRLTISFWVENEVVVGSDVCVYRVVSVGSAELVDGDDSSFRRSFPRKGRAEIMSLDSKSGWMVLSITNARSRRLTPILCLKPPSTISEERRCWVSASSYSLQHLPQRQKNAADYLLFGAENCSHF